MNTQMHGFWKYWMRVWIAATLAFGTVLILAAFPATGGAAYLFEAGIGMFRTNAQAYALPETRALNGITGAVTIGLALSMAVTIRAAAVAGAPAWRGMTLAFLAWFCIDSAVSAAVGFPLNALSNTIFLASFMAPILATGVLKPAGATDGHGAGGQGAGGQRADGRAAVHAQGPRGAQTRIQ